MANPLITGSMPLKQWAGSYEFSTTSAINVISNSSGSDAVVDVDHMSLSNVDGTNAATVTIARYNQDGTALFSEAGTETTAGANVIDGTGVDIIVGLTVPAGGKVVFYDKQAPGRLLENQSYVITPSAGADVTVDLAWTTKGGS
ncbi:hypothetical protein T8K17_11275 [Thalassobaculum sp. OXR-137]|uniref:hypothetical protein n=1 Tax=Thalassobaculum sp. OXR-137 TaxID=3100173 RepID=UPI002AC9E6CC|nr:hypothetical protein [Thalassobaculum sp. OXR-137]WPZ36716.1 hypothetical protein T8K17_11275 [Thalassobaculum sp. OXR-137]